MIDKTMQKGEPISFNNTITPNRDCDGGNLFGEGSVLHTWHIHRSLDKKYCFIRNCDLPQHKGK